MAGGAVVGFFLCYVAHLLNGGKRTGTRRAPAVEKKKMGTMDKVLVLEAILLISYTVADLVVFWHTGAEPYTLTGCVFAVCGLENGVMGWIKTTKEKVRDRRWEQEDRERMRKEEQEAQNNG
ncbi:hypothetical protein DW086_01865 [Harryflintia acetispora]|nr:hypothetical protein DW086_01865 [Harryflintia acetispora]